MKRLCLVILALAFALVAAPANANAAKPCAKTSVGIETFRVAVYSVPCEKAHRVVGRYRAAWNKQSRRSAYVNVLGFRCTGGLGGTQAICWSWRKRVFATSRPDDRHPATWKNPPPKLYRFSADFISRKLMRRKYQSWTAGYAKRSRCPKRFNRRSLWCGTSWLVGDMVYAANFKVTLVPGRWQDRYRITGKHFSFNEYCALVQTRPAKECNQTSKLGPTTIR